MTEARAALRMIREALEQYVPVASEEAVNATRGVAYTDEAEELVEVIHRLADERVRHTP
jgi:hypothetical protein